MKITFATIIILFIGLTSLAQQKDYSKDVATVDATIAALYDVISGDPGQPRDWERFNNLFKPESRLMPTRKTKEGELVVAAMAPSDYVTMFTTRINTGFLKGSFRERQKLTALSHMCSAHMKPKKKKMVLSPTEALTAFSYSMMEKDIM